MYFHTLANKINEKRTKNASKTAYFTLPQPIWEIREWFAVLPFFALSSECDHSHYLIA